MEKVTSENYTLIRNQKKEKKKKLDFVEGKLHVQVSRGKDFFI